MQENNTVSMIIRIIVPSPYHDHWAETQPNSGSLAKTRPTVEISYDLFWDRVPLATSYVASRINFDAPGMAR